MVSFPRAPALVRTQLCEEPLHDFTSGALGLQTVLHKASLIASAKFEKEAETRDYRNNELTSYRRSVWMALAFHHRRISYGWHWCHLRIDHARVPAQQPNAYSRSARSRRLENRV
jgi:hypothetical protein